MNSFFGLEIGKMALQANQIALDVTSNNVANANTDGYTRQRVNMTASQPYTIPAFNSPTTAGQLGTGVTIDQIVRLRDNFTDSMLRSQLNEQGFWDAKGEVLSKIEGVVGEPSDSGLNKVLEQFFSAWQDMSKDPGVNNRTVLIENTQALVNYFHEFSGQLDGLQQDINQTISAKVDEINTIARQIADLNKQISQIELGTQVSDSTGSAVVKQNNANDLRDKRDLLLDTLAQYGNMTYTEDAVSGMVTVSLNGNTLVTGVAVSLVTTSADSQGNTVLNADLGFGSLSGYLAGNQTLNNLRVNLDKLANELVYQVNNLHEQGFNLYGNSGVPFFDTANGTEPGAAGIQLNPAIAGDPNLIAAATLNDPTQNGGDGSNALAIAGLQYKLAARVGGLVDPNAPNTDQTLESFWQAAVFNIGLEGQEATSQSQNHELLVKQLENKRQEVGGVSMDEEMTNMIKFQHGYNAAARLVTTIDEMLDTIINRLGTVGR